MSNLELGVQLAKVGPPLRIGVEALHHLGIHRRRAVFRHLWVVVLLDQPHYLLVCVPLIWLA